MGPDVAEHVVVGSHGVVVHKQLPCEGFVIEVAFEAAHRPFEVVALADDVPCEVFFAVPLSAVGFLEAVELVVELHVVVLRHEALYSWTICSGLSCRLNSLQNSMKSS